MKKNTKGFTLIELLAVIVILAVIALIASPIILSVIDNARKSSQGRSVESFGSAVINASTELQYQNADVSGTYSVTAEGDVYKVCDAATTGEGKTPVCTTVEYSGSRVVCDNVTISGGYVAMKNCHAGNSTTLFNYNNSPNEIDGVAPTKGGAVEQKAATSNKSN